MDFMGDFTTLINFKNCNSKANVLKNVKVLDLTKKLKKQKNSTKYGTKKERIITCACLLVERGAWCS